MRRSNLCGRLGNAAKKVASKNAGGLITVALVIGAASRAHAGDPAEVPCTGTAGPDVIVGEITGVKNWGGINGIGGYSLGTNACNVGNHTLNWFADSNLHPVIAQNIYRLKGGRFEQIGMSWVKHGFFAEADSFCCNCQDPQNGSLLGVGCSDIYSAGLNGNQAGYNGTGGLGPRSEINPLNGHFPFPYGSQGQDGNAIYKRIQIHNDDLNPAKNAGARYFGETQYVSPDDAEAGNQYNNCSWVALTVDAQVDGAWTLLLSGATHTRETAIQAWAANEQGVTLTTVNVPGDGRLIIGSKVTSKGNGTWHYEYAMYNMNCNRAVRRLSIPTPPAVRVTSLRMHDVDYHSGEPYDGTDWDCLRATSDVMWRTTTMNDDVNANALRWGTLYNTRFNANTPPRPVTATIGFFKPGDPKKITVTLPGPSPVGSSLTEQAAISGSDALELQAADAAVIHETFDFNDDGTIDVGDLLTMLQSWGACPDPQACTADVVPDGGDGKVDGNDLLGLLASMGK